MSETVKQSVNRADPNLLADLLRNLKFGDVLRALPVYLRNQTPVADPSFPAGAVGLKLPNDAKSVQGGGVSNEYGAYSRSLGGVVKFAYVTDGAAPASGYYGITASGDVLFNAGDAPTGVDVYYIPEKQDIVTLTLPVSSDVLTIPSTLTALGVVSLLSATVLTGASTGEKIVIANASSLFAGMAHLNGARSTVTFYAGEATKATVTLGVACSTDVNALLEAVAAYV